MKKPETYRRWHIAYSVERKAGGTIVGVLTTSISPALAWPIPEAALEGLTTATREECERRYGPDIETKTVRFLSAMPLG